MTSRTHPVSKTTLQLLSSYTVSSISSTSSSNAESDSITLRPPPVANIDRVLSKLTSLFPVFVLGSAILGSYDPSTLQWVNDGNIISYMLSAVMLGTGMTLQRSDFTNIFSDKSQRSSIPIGVACQFMLMPLSACIVGRTLLLHYVDPISGVQLGKHLFLGLVLVGCSPGGTASNLVTLIAGADVALSVILTACSTVMASAVTPLLTKLIVGNAIPVNGMALCVACAKVVLAPVTFGVLLNEYLPRVCKSVSRWTPFASVLLVSLICGGVVSNNSGMMNMRMNLAVVVTTSTSLLVSGEVGGGMLSSLPVRILLSVILTHTFGFMAGYIVPKHIFGYSERTSRTISIETGMQNSALAIVLAKSMGADPLSYLPGALSATAHSCLGSGLATFWRIIDYRNNLSKMEVNANIDEK